MVRHDYAFPFRIDASSGQAAQTNYAAHVEQMIRQILLTAPGERADLPEFGCGLRQLIFAPHTEALDATTQILVQQSLNSWLAGQIEVKEVRVSTPQEIGDLAKLEIEIRYVLIEMQSDQQIRIMVF